MRAQAQLDGWRRRARPAIGAASSVQGVAGTGHLPAARQFSFREVKMAQQPRRISDILRDLASRPGLPKDVQAALREGLKPRGLPLGWENVPVVEP